MELRACAIAAIFCLSACSGHSAGSGDASPSPQGANQPATGPTVPAANPTPAVTDAEGPTAAGAAAATATDAGSNLASPPLTAVIATATATAAATQNPNLLSFARGTFVRRWTVDASNFSAEALAEGNAWATDGPSAATPELVFELPAIAQISQIAADVALPAGGRATLRFGVATTSEHDFQDAGTIVLDSPAGGQATGSLLRPLKARWLRLQIDRPARLNVRVESLAATGQLEVPPAPLEGRWVVADTLANNDTVFAPANGSIPAALVPAGTSQIATRERNGAFVGATCNYERDVWRGAITGGATHLTDGGDLSVVAGGTLLVGNASGQPMLARRVAHAAACEPPPSGSGPRTVILSRYPAHDDARISDPTIVPGHRFEQQLLPLMSEAQLRGANAAILAFSCQATADTEQRQRQALLDFVRAGHVLIIRDADVCSKSDYALIPYAFTTSASGAQGARGTVLSIADSSALASNDPADRPHYIDTQAYLKNRWQQIGDSDVMKTDDPHWCGLMFAKNVTGSSGWVRAYARYGKGVFVYDGFDVDDMSATVPQGVLLNRLAYDLAPGAELPCNAQVASSLVLLSSVHRTVPYGSPRDFRFAFTLDHEGVTTPEHVALSIGGERARGWRATVSPRSVTLDRAGRHVAVTVHVPGNATASEHLFMVTAIGEGGRTARAAIQFDVNEALAKELETGGRARIYGIHFDVASARIQGRSEATIREIALVMRGHPAWRMRVEGHTDSDGGAADNLKLSERRAQAVRVDLIAHYGVAASRLKAAGYGLTRPVASNATAAGKALNRRVELVRLYVCGAGTIRASCRRSHAATSHDSAAYPQEAFSRASGWSRSVPRSQDSRRHSRRT